MEKTFCGKSCEECTYKEQLGCIGCQNGPGNLWTGDCKLARCCEDKGHKTCATCAHNTSCGLLMSSKNLIPKERIEKAEYETERNERIESMIPKLKKWLPILFWTAIISTIVGFFSDNSLGDTLPTQYSIGYVIQSICALAYGISLLIISTESDFYKTAGILKISSLLCSQIASILTIFTVSWILIILAIAVAALALYGEYNEFKGHAKILEETNPLLSDNWDKLRIGSVICYGALIASIIFACVSSILGAFIAVVASIGILVVGILKLIYLYKTSATFKNL